MNWKRLNRWALSIDFDKETGATWATNGHGLIYWHRDVPSEHRMMNFPVREGGQAISLKQMKFADKGSREDKLVVETYARCLPRRDWRNLLCVEIEDQRYDAVRIADMLACVCPMPDEEVFVHLGVAGPVREEVPTRALRITHKKHEWLIVLMPMVNVEVDEKWPL